MKKATVFREDDRSNKRSVILTALLLALLPAAVAGAELPHKAPRYEKGAQALTQFVQPKRLPSERDSDWLRALNDAWRACPKTSWRINTTRAGHECAVAVHCLAPNSERPLLVFVHGILADHRTWRHVAGPLAADYEVWLVDLPGAGDSGAPDPDSLEPDGYSATGMAERVVQALEQRLAATAERPGQRRIILVGHSLGGLVCLRMLSAPEIRSRHTTLLSQIDRAVLMSTCDFEVNCVPASFVPLLALSGFKVSVGEGLGAFEPAVREMVRKGYFVPECATVEQQVAFGHMLKDSAHRRAIQAMLVQTVPFDPKSHRPDWPRMTRLAQDCASIDIPVLVVWGEWDESLPASMGHQTKDKIRGATLVTIPQRGHSLPSEDPVGCAALIREFAEGLPPGTLRPDLPVNVYPSAPVTTVRTMGRLKKAGG